jgi:hypothetical protein
MNSSPNTNPSHPVGSDRDAPDMNASPAAAVERMGRDLVAAAMLLGAANGKRESAPALAVPLPALASALTGLAAATDDLRVDVLWLLRDAEPLLPHDGNGGAVARAARDFSQLAGRLYASARACESLREHIEPLLDELAVESVAGNDPHDAIGLGADVSRGEQRAA